MAYCLFLSRSCDEPRYRLADKTTRQPAYSFPLQSFCGKILFHCSFSLDDLELELRRIHALTLKSLTGGCRLDHPLDRTGDFLFHKNPVSWLLQNKQRYRKTPSIFLFCFSFYGTSFRTLHTCSLFLRVLALRHILFRNRQYSP